MLTALSTHRFLPPSPQPAPPLGTEQTGQGPGARGPCDGRSERVAGFLSGRGPVSFCGRLWAVFTALPQVRPRGTHTAVPWASWAPPSCYSAQSRCATPFPAAGSRSLSIRPPCPPQGPAALWPPDGLSRGRVAASDRGSVCARCWVGPPGESPIRGRVTAFSLFCCRVQVPALVTWRLAGPSTLQVPLHCPDGVCTEPWVLMKSKSAVSHVLLLFLVSNRVIPCQIRGREGHFHVFFQEL